MKIGTFFVPIFMERLLFYKINKNSLTKERMFDKIMWIKIKGGNYERQDYNKRCKRT